MATTTKVKTYSALKTVSPQLKSAIRSALQTHEKYRKAYFWSSGGNAGTRRRNEKAFAKSNPDFDIIIPKGKIEVRFSYSESAKNVYYALEIWVNDKKSNIKTLKSLL